MITAIIGFLFITVAIFTSVFLGETIGIIFLPMGIILLIEAIRHGDEVLNEF